MWARSGMLRRTYKLTGAKRVVKRMKDAANDVLAANVGRFLRSDSLKLLRSLIGLLHQFRGFIAEVEVAPGQ